MGDQSLLLEADLDLQKISDASLQESERLAAFEHMLALSGGWWGPGTLRDFAKVCALAALRRGRRDAVDRIDWEGIADEALVVLYRKASTIENPRAWLNGVVRILIKREMEDFNLELNADELLDIHAETMPTAFEEEIERAAMEDEPAREAAPALLEAIQQLPPSLQRVAMETLVNGLSRRKTCELLGIGAGTLRQRLQRMRARLRKLFPPDAG